MAANLHISLTTCTHESRLFKQTSSLLKAGVYDEVYISGLADTGGDLPLEEVLPDGQQLKRVVLKSRKLRIPVVGAIFKLTEWMWKLLFYYRGKGIKVVTVHSLGSLFLGVLFKWFYGAKLVFDAHELETERNGLVGRKKKVAKFTERLLIGKVHRLVVVSETIRQDYIQRYGNKLKEEPALVLNCPKYQEVPKHNLFREEFGIAPETKIFLYQGALFKGRGLELMLETFKDYNAQERVLIFMGYGELDEQVQEYASKYDSILFKAAVPPSELLQWTSSADVGISILVFKETTCLSYYYSLPNKFFEYTMAGLLTISSNLPEYVGIAKEYGVGAWIEENTPDALTKAVNETEMRLQSDNAETIRKIAKTYNWEEQEKELLKAYQDL